MKSCQVQMEHYQSSTTLVHFKHGFVSKQSEVSSEVKEKKVRDKKEKLGENKGMKKRR